MLGKGEVLGGEKPRFRVEGLSPPNKLCTFDPFSWGIPFYTFYYTCEETGHKLNLNDGSLRIFLNTDTTELATLDAKLQAFYHYIQKGAVESDLSQTICDKITTLKNDSITRRYYMMTSLKIADLQRDAREEGISLGLQRGMERGAYQTKLETAKAMIVIGLPEEQIQLCTGLPLETIQDMAKN